MQYRATCFGFSSGHPQGGNTKDKTYRWYIY